MIGSLQGTLIFKQPPWLRIDVGGVGYELEAPMSTCFALPAIGQPVTLLTHLLVREDAQLLYGFATDAEKTLFRNLLKVSGVGARVALAILSGISVDGFRQCVEFEDAARLQKVPGIGKKTAERLIVEMRGRLEETASTSRASTGSGLTGDPGAVAINEATSALVALGYKPAEVARLLKGMDSENMSAEALIREALRSAGVSK